MTILDKLTAKDIERFWSKVDKRGDDECWKWNGCKTRKGAGIFCANINDKNKNITAHHISYFIKYNIDAFTIPMEKLCETIGCCNPDHYKIKNKKSNDDFEINEKFINRFWKKVIIKKDNECWEWTASLDSKGYGHFMVNYKSIRSHRVSYMIAHGKNSIPDGLCVCHKCDNRKCVNPNHLFLGTNYDNVQDRHNKGRSGSAKGENHGGAKLNSQQVREIRLLLNANMSRKVIAKKYNISKSNINNIYHYKCWKDVTI
jgi:hypothetical protein